MPDAGAVPGNTGGLCGHGPGQPAPRASRIAPRGKINRPLSHHAGQVTFETALEMARSACERRRDEPLIHYREETLSGRDVAAASDALACALAARGVGAGDRVAIYLQNVPAWPLAAIAAWKLGAIAVPINPMLRERELDLILSDSGAKAMIADPDLPRGDVDVLITEPDALIARHAGERPPGANVAADDVACLVYTSGTTGPPKG